MSLEDRKSNEQLAKKNARANWEFEFSDEEMALISTISQSVDRPIPVNAHSTSSDQNVDVFSKIDSIKQFYEWFDSLQKDYHEENEAYRSHLEFMNEKISATQSLLESVQSSENNLLDIETNANIVAKKTEELHHVCEGLVSESKVMNVVSQNLKSYLSKFDQLDIFTAYLNSPDIKVNEQGFIVALRKLDDSILFLQSNPLFVESESYLVKFKQLQNKGLTMIKNYICTQFKEIAQEIIKASRAQNINVPSLPSTPLGTPNKFGSSSASEATTVATSTTSNLAKAALSNAIASKIELSALPMTMSDQEISLFYIKLNACAARLNPLCIEIENQSNVRKEYLSLLWDCQNSYFSIRKTLLREIVQKNIMILVQTQQLQIIVRCGCIYLVNVCVMEYNLFNQFFSMASSGLSNLLEEFSQTLYDNIRPLVLKCNDIDDLCTVVHIVKNEIIAREIEKNGKFAKPVLPIVQRLLSDIQQRLIFVAMNSIRDLIQYFVPKEDDLNFLKKVKEKSDYLKERQLTWSEDEIANDENLEKSHLTWFPTVARTLAILTKLYLSIDNDTFDDIAQVAINSCLQSIKTVHPFIEKSHGVTAGHLFVICQLKVLKEEIKQFDLSLTCTEAYLDFSDTLKALRMIWSRKLFSLNKENALYQVIVSTRIKTSQVDYYKDMENYFSQSIEAFRTDVHSEILKDLLQWISKFSLILHQRRNQQIGESGPNAVIPDRIDVQKLDFAKPEILEELIEKTMKNLHAKVTVLCETLHTCINNNQEVSEIYKPLKNLFIETIQRLNSIIDENYEIDGPSETNETTELMRKKLKKVDVIELSKFLDRSIMLK